MTMRPWRRYPTHPASAILVAFGLFAVLYLLDACGRVLSDGWLAP